MKAIVQGEFHASRSDRETLRSRVTEDVDALFVERRADRIGPDGWGLGYVWFVVGVLTLYWFQDVLDRGPAVEDTDSVPVHDEIDTPLPDLYRRLPRSWKLAAGVLTAGIFLVGLSTPYFTIPYVATPLAFDIVYTVIVKLVTVLGAPLLYSFVLVALEERFVGGRDEDMARAITGVSRENGYRTVVVACGEAHVTRLRTLLEDRGWEVEVHESNQGWANVLK